jgi:hypothetical protein
VDDQDRTGESDIYRPGRVTEEPDTEGHGRYRADESAEELPRDGETEGHIRGRVDDSGDSILEDQPEFAHAQRFNATDDLDDDTEGHGAVRR